MIELFCAFYAIGFVLAMFVWITNLMAFDLYRQPSIGHGFVVAFVCALWPIWLIPYLVYVKKG